MRSPFFYILVISLLVSCKDKASNAVVDVNEEKATLMPVYDFEGLEPLLLKEDDKTYIINFWATWCKPCVKELPAFEAVNTAFGDKDVEVVLVSLDFPDKIESHVLPFIEKHGLKSTVVLLDDVDSNTWIPKVSEVWSGAIPATLIYNQNTRKFYERSFTYDELLTELNTFLQ